MGRYDVCAATNSQECPSEVYKLSHKEQCKNGCHLDAQSQIAKFLGVALIARLQQDLSIYSNERVVSPNKHSCHTIE